MGFLSVLTLIFITLKLTNFIDWSWWWVLAPTIVDVVIALIAVGFITWMGMWSTRR